MTEGDGDRFARSWRSELLGLSRGVHYNTTIHDGSASRSEAMESVGFGGQEETIYKYIACHDALAARVHRLKASETTSLYADDGMERFTRPNPRCKVQCPASTHQVLSAYWKEKGGTSMHSLGGLCTMCTPSSRLCALGGGDFTLHQMKQNSSGTADQDDLFFPDQKMGLAGLVACLVRFCLTNFAGMWKSVDSPRVCPIKTP